MKKILFALVAFAAVSTGAFAGNNVVSNAFNGNSSEFYVGGNANIRLIFSGNTTFGFGLAPEIGWQFDDDMAVGIALNYAFATQSYKQVDYNIKGSNSSNTFYFSPYFRWSFAELGSLHFSLDAVVDLGCQVALYTRTTDGVTVKSSDPAQFAYGVGVRPVVTYDFLNDWQLFATIGRLGWSGVGNSGYFDINALATVGLGVYYRF